MERKPFRGGSQSGKETSCFKSRGNFRRKRNRQEHWFQNENQNDYNVDNDQSSSSVSSVNETTTSGTIPTEIPGYYFDNEKNRYFKITKDYPKKMENNTTVTSQKPVDRNVENGYCHSLSHYLKSRELSSVFNDGILKRKGLECWARRLVEKKSFVLTNGHPFKGCISTLALSSKDDKLATVLKLPGLDCDTINMYDVDHDKESFINLKMLLTIVASEVTHIEWNTNKNMENYILLSLLGSEKSKGCGVVCKFNESLQSCDLHSFPLPHGTAWHCSWCRNPLYSHLLGIAGTKQAVLIDFDKKTSFCRINSPSDVFCVEFCHRSPVIYLGCRNGDIMCVDVRMKSKKQNKPFNINSSSSSSTTWIKMMYDENYFMASNSDGLIKMWDVRLSRPVKEYLGNVNETKLIPFVMDSSQSIIASAGQDGKTRIWSMDSCDLLNTIDCPSDEVTIPPVCLGEQWGNKGGLMGFGIGVDDRLDIYY